MNFARTLGVDIADQSVTVTASTGRRARGLQREVEDPLVLSGAGQSISGAMVAVATQGDRTMFYGYVDQLLLGESVCQSGITATLDYLAHDDAMGLGTELWAVDGDAQTAIQSGGDVGVDTRLETLHAENLDGVGAITRTAGELYSDILEQNATFIPRLAAAEAEGAPLQNAGYTIIIGDVATFDLSGDEARGLELLMGSGGGDVFSADGVAVELTAVRTSITPTAGTFGATVACHITAAVRECPAPLTEGGIDAISRQLASAGCQRIAAALSRLQAGGGDAIGLMGRLAMSAPWWGERLDATAFGALPLTVAVDVQIEGRCADGG